MRVVFSALVVFATTVVVHGAYGQSPDGPSFDCQKARSPSERIICADKELSRMDRELAVLYKASRASARDPQDFVRVSAEELRTREKSCQDRACLVQWYEKRKLQLTAVGVPVPEVKQPAVAITTQSAPPPLTTSAAKQASSFPPVGAKEADLRRQEWLVGKWECRMPSKSNRIYGVLQFQKGGGFAWLSPDSGTQAGRFSVSTNLIETVMPGLKIDWSIADEVNKNAVVLINQVNLVVGCDRKG